MMEGRRGYKKTKLGWIPEDWQVVKLGEICEVKRGASPRPIKNPKWFGGNVGWVRISDVTASKKYLNHTKDYLSDEGVNKSVRIKKGEIILSICATIGVPIIMNIDACIHDGFVWFDGLPDTIDREFFYYFLLFNSNKFASNRQIGTQGNLNTNIVSSFYFPLMEIAEQKKIAAILSTVDEKIAAIDEQIAEREQLKKGLMQQLLTKGIGHSEFKETKIGKIPKDWDVIKLISLSIDGIKNGAFNDPKKVGKGYKLINVVNLYSKPHIKTESLGLLELNENEFKKYKVEKEDVFFTRSSLKLEGIAHCNINISNEENLIYECHIMRIRPDKTKINPFYLRYYCISNPARKFFMSHAKQVTMTTISQSDIAGMPIPLPPIHEQEKIAAILSTVDDKLEVLREKKEEYRVLKKGLMQQLLTGSLRVRIKGD